MPGSGSQVSLSAEQSAWYQAACERIRSDHLAQLVGELVDIHSPTGEERELAAFLAGRLKQLGFDAHCFPTGERGGNCLGRLRGSGGGPGLLLYAPLDTHLDARPDRDVPWVGPALRDDMLPRARREGDIVIGLGASNPKSMIAIAVEAARCVAAAGVPLLGDLLVGGAGGGMPWLAPDRPGAGLSSGVRELLASDHGADMAVIVKPWDEVYYEHPGLVWFKVTVWGTLGYAGIPRGVPGFESAIVPAARVVAGIEEWLARYPGTHERGQVRPEGWIGAMRSGWPEKPAFPGAACEIYVDVRLACGQTVEDLEKEFSSVMAGIVRRHPGIRTEWETVAACPAARTDPGHWIVQSALRGWEAAHGRPYAGAPPMSGQTDAAEICRAGLPVVRVGFPFLDPQRVPAEYQSGLGGMGVTYIPDLVDCCRMLIHIIIDTCTRTRQAVGV